VYNKTIYNYKKLNYKYNAVVAKNKETKDTD